MKKLKLRFDALGKELAALAAKEVMFVESAKTNLTIRRQDAERELERKQTKVQSAQGELTKTRQAAEKKQAEDEAAVNAANRGKEAARRTASNNMAKPPVSIEFSPSTTKMDIDEAVKRKPDSIARDLGLPLGLGPKSGFLDTLSYVSGACCFAFLTLQFALMFRGISFTGSGVRTELLPLIASAAVALAIILAAQVILRKLWAEVGVRYAGKRGMALIATIATMLLVIALIGWSIMDAHVIFSMANARARLNSSAAITWEHALIIGSLIGGLSNIAVAAAGFTTGYRREASSLVEAAREDDVTLAKSHPIYAVCVDNLSTYREAVDECNEATQTLEENKAHFRKEIEARAKELQTQEMERDSMERRIPKRVEDDFLPDEKRLLAEVRAQMGAVREEMDAISEQLFEAGSGAGPLSPAPTHAIVDAVDEPLHLAVAQ